MFCTSLEIVYVQIDIFQSISHFACIEIIKDQCSISIPEYELILCLTYPLFLCSLLVFSILPFQLNLRRCICIWFPVRISSSSLILFIANILTIHVHLVSLHRWENIEKLWTIKFLVSFVTLSYRPALGQWFPLVIRKYRGLEQQIHGVGNAVL